MSDSNAQDSTAPKTGAAEGDAPSHSRRAFLRGAARKAAYVTPVVLTFAASQARAGSEIGSVCGDTGSPCAVDADCCPGMTCPLGSCV